MARSHVVVIGGGFGGLQAVLGLRGAPVQVTLIDRRNHHLFQPLLYQVATGGLSPANIASPLRAIVRKQKNIRVLLETVTGVDVDRRQVLLGGSRLSYDTLVVAVGSQPNYFGKDKWIPLAPSLKNLDDAVSIRNRVLFAFEEAERASNIEQSRSWLTFVIIGGGATGVELAGALGELKRQTLKGNFRHVDPSNAKVVLLEAGDRILPTFPPRLSAKAAHALKHLGITVCTNTFATDIQPGRLTAQVRGTSTMEIQARTILWTAGVQGSPLGEAIAYATKTQIDKHSRLMVEPDLSIAGHPEILVVGDLAHCRDPHGQPLPAIAPVAIQEGRYVAKLLRARLGGRVLPPFRYSDRGSMAAIGRGVAVVDLKWICFAGWLGWITWLFVHLLYIVRFENRLLILIQWAWNYFTRNRSARLITDQVSQMSEGPVQEGTGIGHGSGEGCLSPEEQIGTTNPKFAKMRQRLGEDQ
jgi:NADH:ubiquinone reductase (H+-translocating)